MKDKTEYLKKKYSDIYVANSIDNLLDFLSLKYIFLCTKPTEAKNICEFIKNNTDPSIKSKILVSILAGTKISTLKKYTYLDMGIIRIMPNVATLIGKGCGGISFSEEITKEQEETLYDLMNQIGHYIKVPESKMDAITSLSGSGPGFVYTFIEAFIDSGVAVGLSREESRELVLQTILGSTELMIKENKHPAELRDRVTSPGGTTIAGIKELEKNNFRNALISAVDKAYEKSVELGKNE